jgi:hypothetical protein
MTTFSFKGAASREIKRKKERKMIINFIPPLNLLSSIHPLLFKRDAASQFHPIALC